MYFLLCGLVAWKWFASSVQSASMSITRNMWLNMAAPLGIKVNYVLGEIVDASDLGIHGDFTVRLEDVLDASTMMEFSRI